MTAIDAGFQLKSFQLLSDAGSVSREKYLLSWGSLVKPQEDTFPDAPPGRYQQVQISLGGDLVDYAVSIHGVWSSTLNGPVPFSIETKDDLEIDIGCAKVLAAGASTEVPIDLDLTNAINSVSFKDLPVTNGTITLDDSNAKAIGDFRNQLTNAFKIDN